MFRSIEPAWNDANLREISPHIRSGLVMAHIRAAIGSPVQQTNCHPFRHENWLFMHNGFLGGFHDVKRDLVLEIDPSLYPSIEGSADTEVLFYLALTYGLQDDPIAAMERAIGFVEATGHKHGVEFPFQGSVATSDGDRLWAFRYSSDGAARSLFFSSPIPELRRMYPDNELLQRLGDEARLVVSEPLGDVAGVWNMVPESSCGIVQDGPDVLRPFTPTPPAKAPEGKAQAGGRRRDHLGGDNAVHPQAHDHRPARRPGRGRRARGRLRRERRRAPARRRRPPRRGRTTSAARSRRGRRRCSQPSSR